MNPPTIHRDFRQLAEVIVTDKNLSHCMCSDVFTTFLYVAIFERYNAKVGQPEIVEVSQILIDPDSFISNLFR